MDALLFSFFIAAVIIGGIVWLMSSFSKSKENYIDQRLQGIENFSADLIFKSGICDNAIALDRNRKRIAVVLNAIKTMSMSLEPIVYNFDELIAVEVIKDDMSVTKTNRGSQIASAAVGGILLGSAGLLLGGLSGSKRHESKISKLSLRLYTSDLAFPVQEIHFWDSGSNGVDPSSLQPVIAEMDQWYGRLRVIVETPKSDVS